MKYLSNLSFDTLILALSVAGTNAILCGDQKQPGGIIKMIKHGEVNVYTLNSRFQVKDGVLDMPCDGQAELRLDITSKQKPPRSNDSLGVYVANCTLKGRPLRGGNATVGMHDMLPFLRPNKDEVSEMVSAQCSLMQNQLYIALNMDEGIAKVDYGIGGEQVFSGQVVKPYNTYSSRVRGQATKYDVPFNVERLSTSPSGNRTILAKCGASGVVPFDNRPTIHIMAKAPFFKVEGIDNSNKTVPEGQVFKVECTAVPVKPVSTEKAKMHATSTGRR